MNVLRKTEIDIRRKVRKRRREEKVYLQHQLLHSEKLPHRTQGKLINACSPLAWRDDSVDVRKKERKIFYIVLSETRASFIRWENSLDFCELFSTHPQQTKHSSCVPMLLALRCLCCLPLLLLFDTLSHRGTYPTRFLPFFMSSRVLWIVR